MVSDHLARAKNGWQKRGQATKSIQVPSISLGLAKNSNLQYM